MGIVYIALVLFAIFNGDIALIGIFGFFMASALYEYYHIIEKAKQPNHTSRIFHTAAGLVFYLIYAFTSSYLYVYSASAIYLFILFFSAILSKQDNTFKDTVLKIFGQIYITFPFLLLISFTNLSSYPVFHLIADKYSILGIFIFIWINDTAAYVVGSLIGKNKLIEHISPKKTIEGFVGGLFITVAVGYLFGSMSDSFNVDILPHTSIIFWVLFALIAVLSGTIGDLFESLIKRTYGFKDSGRLLPGHGGMLDRIDSLLFAIPAIYIFVRLWSYISFHYF